VLNIWQVERKRKEMQRRMFQKFEDMEKSDVLAEEVMWRTLTGQRM
jgi:hypothetical protein